jgi:hypothetical protein
MHVVDLISNQMTAERPKAADVCTIMHENILWNAETVAEAARTRAAVLLFKTIEKLAGTAATFHPSDCPTKPAASSCHVRWQVWGYSHPERAFLM